MRLFPGKILMRKGPHLPELNNFSVLGVQYSVVCGYKNLVHFICMFCFLNLLHLLVLYTCSCKYFIIELYDSTNYLADAA